MSCLLPQQFLLVVHVCVCTQAEEGRTTNTQQRLQCVDLVAATEAGDVSSAVLAINRHLCCKQIIRVPIAVDLALALCDVCRLEQGAEQSSVITMNNY